MPGDWRSGTGETRSSRSASFGLTGERGQPRGGRQGVLVVPRRRAQPRVEPLALPLPAGAFPYEDLCLRTGAGAARSRVRAPRHRGVRRRPVLDRRGRLRQGRPARRPDGGPGHQRQPLSCDTLHVLPTALVPQHLVLGGRQPRGPSLAVNRGRHSRSCIHPFLGELALQSWPSPDGVAPTAFCSARTRPTRSRLYVVYSSPPYPKDVIDDHVVARAATVNPGASSAPSVPCWHRLTVASWVDRRGAAAPAACRRAVPWQRVSLAVD